MAGASGGVSVKHGVDLDPLEHQELLKLQCHPGGLRDEVLGDQNLGAFVSQVLVELHVGLAGVGVDRHLGVATSTDGGEVVQCNRSAELFYVVPDLVRHQDLQRFPLDPSYTGIRPR